MTRRSLLLMTLFMSGAVLAQDGNRRELGDNLDAKTVQELSSRLMQMQGKLDPKTIQKMIEETLKSNPGINKDELLKKIASQQSGIPQDQIDKFLPLLNEKFFDQLKDMAKQGKVGPDGKLPTEMLTDIAKKFNAEASKFNPPKSDPSGFKTPAGKMPDISPTAKSVMQFWEKNLGPLGNSPAVKDAIQRMFASSLTVDGKPTNFFGFMEQSGYSGQGFANWINSASSGPGWRWPKWIGGGSSSGSYGGGSWSWGSGGGSSTAGTEGLSGGGSWWSVVLFVVIAGGGLVLWWLWPRLMQGGEPTSAAAAATIQGIDPASVVDRETLVKVFEALSLSLIGNDAKVWTHSTIGQALREFLAKNPSAADRLALIYALARYTPAEEPFPPGNLQEARTHLGQLAGAKPE